MRVGFTGTQRGMTRVQEALVASMVRHPNVTAIHHGDCIGADMQVHAVAIGAGKWTVVHPPIKQDKRAWCVGSEVLEPKAYDKRNADIVLFTDRLIAAPEGPEKSFPRSGTWMTVRMARSRGRQITIVWPNGTVTREPGNG